MTPQQQSDRAQNEVGKLLSKSRRLRAQLAELAAEILRLGREIARKPGDRRSGKPPGATDRASARSAKE